MQVQDALSEIMALGMDISFAQSVTVSGESYKPHKDGGIFTKPHLGLIAEAGYPEAAIPIDGSKNAIDLWLKTGELLGMDGLTGGPSPLADDIAEAAYSGAGETVIQIDNSKTITVYGDSPTNELEEMLESEDEKFAQLMERYLANGRRTRFY